MPTFEEGTAFTQAILPEYSKRAFYKPTAEEAAKAKALLNFLMEDPFFLALYRSNAESRHPFTRPHRADSRHK